MKQEEHKTFEQQKDGSLKVTVETKNALLLPLGGDKGNVDIGEYIQTTVQHIRKENVVTLKGFIETEKNKAHDQISKLKAQLENLKDVNPDLLSEDMKAKFEKAYGKGNKAFKEELKMMNSYILQGKQKQQTEAQLKYLEEQMVVIDKDLEEISRI